MNASITLGFLHLGRREHGVCLFGRRLAEEAKKRAGVIVIEKEIVLNGDPVEDNALLREATHFLSKADIVQIQFTEEIWGVDKHRLQNLKAFLDSCSSRVVATIHDTESINSFFVIEHSLLVSALLSRVRQLVRLVWLQCKFFLNKGGFPYGLISSNAWIRRWLINRIDYGFVSTYEEKRRILVFLKNDKCAVIPHYVENRFSLPDRKESRKELGLEGHKVVTLLGFIFEGKGHSLLLRALAKMPDKEIMVVFAGGPALGSEFFSRKLMKLAQSLGVVDRLRITGYLEEHVLEKYLVSTDLAVCPYSVCFASGSLSTWISVACPILVSDLPQFREYNTLSPRSLMFFSPYSKMALVHSMKEILSAPFNEERNFSMKKLKEQLSIQETFNRYLNYYKTITSSRWE